MREDHQSVRDFTDFTISNPASSRELMQNAVNIERTDIDKYLDQLEHERAWLLAALDDTYSLLDESMAERSPSHDDPITIAYKIVTETMIKMEEG